MAVTPGTRIGAYEVRSLLGMGGMGEVYLAHDTNLGRDVALKILPESFARDPDRLARFKREAQVLGSFPIPAGKWQISQEGGFFPRWRGDARELFYYAVDGRLMAVAIAGETAVEVGTTVPLFEARMLNGPNTIAGFRPQYDVTRDGQRFLLNAPLEEAASSSITVMINWTTRRKQ